MPSKARSYAVTVRFSEDEKMMLKALAEEHGATISTAVRLCVRRMYGSKEFTSRGLSREREKYMKKRGG